jgi:hypothetical protein
METSLFYTFSTIAQVLAAAFGVLSIFVMMKMQFIIDQCYYYANRLNTDFKYTTSEDSQRAPPKHRSGCPTDAVRTLIALPEHERGETAPDFIDGSSLDGYGSGAL